MEQEESFDEEEYGDLEDTEKEEDYWWDAGFVAYFGYNNMKIVNYNKIIIILFTSVKYYKQ